MLGHDRREGRREERQAFGRGGTDTRYQMREKLRSVGDDSWIEDESGRRALTVDGKALRLRRMLVLEDPRGNELNRGVPPRPTTGTTGIITTITTPPER